MQRLVRKFAIVSFDELLDLVGLLDLVQKLVGCFFVSGHIDHLDTIDYMGFSFYYIRNFVPSVYFSETICHNTEYL